MKNSKGNKNLHEMFAMQTITSKLDNPSLSDPTQIKMFCIDIQKVMLEIVTTNENITKKFVEEFLQKCQKLSQSYILISQATILDQNITQLVQENFTVFIESWVKNRSAFLDKILPTTQISAETCLFLALNIRFVILILSKINEICFLNHTEKMLEVIKKIIVFILDQKYVSIFMLAESVATLQIDQEEKAGESKRQNSNSDFIEMSLSFAGKENINTSQIGIKNQLAEVFNNFFLSLLKGFQNIDDCMTEQRVIEFIVILIMLLATLSNLELIHIKRILIESLIQLAKICDSTFMIELLECAKNEKCGKFAIKSIIKSIILFYSNEPEVMERLTSKYLDELNQSLYELEQPYNGNFVCAEHFYDDGINQEEWKEYCNYPSADLMKIARKGCEKATEIYYSENNKQNKTEFSAKNIMHFARLERLNNINAGQRNLQKNIIQEVLKNGSYQVTIIDSTNKCLYLFNYFQQSQKFPIFVQTAIIDNLISMKNIINEFQYNELLKRLICLDSKNPRYTNVLAAYSLKMVKLLNSEETSEVVIEFFDMISIKFLFLTKKKYSKLWES